MALIKIQQGQISGTVGPVDNVLHDDLVKSGRTLDDDLNSLRSQIKRIQGTGAWIHEISGSQDLYKIYEAMRVDSTDVQFQNDVNVINDLVVTGSVEVLETVKSLGGFSGSLTKLSNGDDYLLEGNNITLFTGAIGNIEITANPGDIEGGVQYNVEGLFTANNTFIFQAGNSSNSSPMGKLYLTGSMAQGSSSVAPGDNSHAQGYSTLSTGSYSHAEGSGSISFGQYSHAEGGDTLASGSMSHSEGLETEASGQAAHSEGWATFASGSHSHAEGYGTEALGDGSHAEGSGSFAIGEYSHAEGEATTASGSFSHAEGQGTIASGSHSHAEGFGTIARGQWSHAAGSGSFANGEGSHAEGKLTTADGDYAFAGGFATQATGDASFAFGSGTVALSNFSFAVGEGTVASGSAQFIAGAYNKHTNAESIFVIGNGTSDLSRSDIFIVNPDLVMVGSGSVGSDVFFYVGTHGNANKALFSGSIYASGTVSSVGGFTGSLTTLMNGSEYLRPEVGIEISTGSLGEVYIGNDLNSVAKGIFMGDSALINDDTSILTFSSIGTLAVADWKHVDVYLNGAYLSYGPGKDLSDITKTSIKIDESIVDSLLPEDIISVTLRNIE